VAAWPIAARAQLDAQPKQIAVLMTNAESDPQGQQRIAAFRRGLQELGWAEGRSLQIQLRWSGGNVARIREYTAELVRLAPDLIVANGTPVLAALKGATSSIPIVFVVVNDPVAQGFVSSIARPGGNITGFSF
jgi:putative ABC transport system substrate-binding protein